MNTVLRVEFIPNEEGWSDDSPCITSGTRAAFSGINFMVSSAGLENIWFVVYAISDIQ